MPDMREVCRAKMLYICRGNLLALLGGNSAAGFRCVIVAPPYCVQRRAWERAYVLRQEFDEFLSLEQRIRAEVVMRTSPERLGWNEISDMVGLYSAIAGVRI